IEITIPAEIDNEEILEIEEPGSVVLTGRFFVDIIKKLSGDFVDLETTENFQTKITAGKSEFNLSGNDSNQYPLLPEVNDADSLVLSSAVLQTIINQTNFAVSLSETRPVLTRVNWNFNKDNISFTATHSHRLALIRLLHITFKPEVLHSSYPCNSLP